MGAEELGVGFGGDDGGAGEVAEAGIEAGLGGARGKDGLKGDDLVGGGVEVDGVVAKEDGGGGDGFVADGLGHVVEDGDVGGGGGAKGGGRKQGGENEMEHGARDRHGLFYTRTRGVGQRRRRRVVS